MDLAIGHKDWAAEGRKEVIFSHETKNNKLGSDERKWAHRLPGEGLTSRLVEGTLKYGGGSVMVWGCVFHACRMDGMIDGDLCTKVLDGELMLSIAYL